MFEPQASNPEATLGKLTEMVEEEETALTGTGLRLRRHDRMAGPSQGVAKGKSACLAHKLANDAL